MNGVVKRCQAHRGSRNITQPEEFWNLKGRPLELEQDENPLFNRNVKRLTGRLDGDYGLRAGDWRLLFTPDKEHNIIHVYATLPRGDAYRCKG